MMRMRRIKRRGVIEDYFFTRAEFYDFPYKTVL
jgi:hypothetical protein